MNTFTYVLVMSIGGVNEQVYVTDDESKIIDKLNRWLPELRAGRVALRDYGYKRAVVSEDGRRNYEIFEFLMTHESKEQEVSMEEKLLEYLKARDEERRNEVEAFLDSLSKDERQLVKEAAVMGYVQGVQAERAKVENIPPDSEIVHRVVAACQSFDDLYPRIGGKK